MTRTNTRTGFTLIELLVAMAIITTLAGFILLVYPGARDQDRVRNTVSDVEIALRMAQGMAARDKSPRGVRFIFDATKADYHLVTELQYVEMPPPLVPKLKTLVNTSLNSVPNLEAEPRVRFDYDISTGATGDPPAGTIKSRRCVIQNLNSDQVGQVKANCTIVMPAFGSWHKISQIPAATISRPPANATVANPYNNGLGTAQKPLFDLEVTLEVYPDAILGGGTSAVVYHFAIYLLATPLVGEPTVLLPKNTCVDLNAPDTSVTPSIPLGSLGPLAPNTTDFDVIFGPDGKLVGAPTGQLFLLVRDYAKVPDMRLQEGAALLDAFRRAGDMYYISVRSSGTLGHGPVLWPNGTGAYDPGTNPFTLIRQELNQ